MPERERCFVNLELVSATCNLLEVAWKCDARYEYCLEWPSPIEGWLAHVLTPPLVRSSLIPDTRYKFRLRQRSVGTELWSLPSDTQEFKTSYEMPLPLCQPAITATTTNSTATIKWTVPDTASTPLVIQRYRVLLHEEGGFCRSHIPDAGGDRISDAVQTVTGAPGEEEYNVFTTHPYCTFTDLKSGATYVASITNQSKSNIWSAFCPDVVFTTGSSVPNAILPVHIQANEGAFACLDLYWQQPKCNGAPILGYEVECSDVNGESHLQSVGTRPEAVFQDLAADMGFTVRVRAKNKNGFASWSKPYACRTLCPARFASDITLTHATSDTLEVAWTRVASKSHIITEYILETCRRGFEWVETHRADVHDTSHAFTYSYELLPANAEVAFRCRARSVRDGVEFLSPPGPAATYSTLSARPLPPQRLQFTDDYETALSWEPAPTHGLPLLSTAIKICGADRTPLNEVLLQAKETAGNKGTQRWLWDTAYNPGEGVKVIIFVAVENAIGRSVWSKPLELVDVGRGKMTTL